MMVTEEESPLETSKIDFGTTEDFPIENTPKIPYSFFGSDVVKIFIYE